MDWDQAISVKWWIDKMPGWRLMALEQRALGQWVAVVWHRANKHRAEIHSRDGLEQFLTEQMMLPTQPVRAREEG